MYIYTITNNLNGKVYVGKSNDPEVRWRQHIYRSKNYNFPLYRAIRKYGVENFTFEVIENCQSEKDAYIREQFWIGHLGTFTPGGYNATTGGDGSYQFSQEAKSKISNVLKEMWANGYTQDLTPERRRNLSKGIKKSWADGKRQRIASEATRQKMSEAKIGHIPWNKGMCLSQEHKDRLSKAHLGVPLGAEHREKISDGNRGKVRTPEQKRNYRSAQRKRFALERFPISVWEDDGGAFL